MHIFLQKFGKVSKMVILKGIKKAPYKGGFWVVMSGLEPPTHGFSVRCSTN